MKQQPGAFCDAVFAKSCITQAVQNYARNDLIGDKAIAKKMVDTLMEHIELNPSVYHDFIKIIEELGPWAESFLKIMNEWYNNEYKPVSAESGCCHKDSSEVNMETQLQADIQDIDIKFSNLFASCRDSLEQNDVPLDKIRDFILSIDAFTDKNSVNVLDPEHELKIDAATDIYELFNFLPKYVSFFNYEIIGQLIHQLGSHKDKKRFEAYLQAFNSFYKQNVCEIPRLNAYLNYRLTAKKFIFKYTQQQLTLQDVQEIRDKVAKVFGLCTSTLQLSSIIESCAEIHFFISTTVAEQVLPVSPDQLLALSKFGVKAISSRETQKTYRSSSGGQTVTTEVNSAPNTQDLSQPMAEDIVTHDSPLHTAARQGNFDEVKQLLETKEFNIESRNSENQTPLHLACANGHLDTVALLVYEFHADMRAIDSDEYTPLLLAAKNNHIQTVMMLIVRAFTAYQYMTSKKIEATKCTTIHYNVCLVDSCHHEMLEKLILRYSRDPQALEDTAQMIQTFFNHYTDYEDKSFFPLFLAASLGLKNLIDTLVINGFSLNVKGFFSMSVLNCACFGGHVELINSLISMHGVKYKAVTDIDGLSILHYTAAGGSVKAISLLVNTYGMNVECSDHYNQTPIFSAACYGRAKAIKHLMNRYQCKIHSSWSLLCCACSFGHIAVVDMLIQEYNLDPSERHDDGNTFLHIAAASGQVETVRHLINNNKANVNDTNKKGSTPLMLAVEAGRVELVCTLIKEFSCSPHEKDCNGWTLLHYACCSGSLQMVNKLLSKYEVNLDTKNDNGDTPLHLAARNGKVETVRCLIKNKANINDINKEGFTPMMLAILNGKMGVISMLTDKLSSSQHEKNFDGWTLLHYACHNGHIQIMDKLVTKYKFDPVAKDAEGNTPLHLAAKNGQVKTVRHLINNYNADVSVTNKTGFTPFISAILNGRVKVACVLIEEFSCSPHEKDSNGWTLLHYACQNGHIQMVEKLVTEYSLNPVAEDNRGNTPLHSTAMNGQFETVRHLINNLNANVNNTNKTGETPLMLAALNGKVELVSMLIEEFTCSPHEKCYNGFTLLHFACQNGHIQMVDKLVTEYKLDPMVKDDNGDTPLHIAAMNGQTETVRHLICMYNANANITNKIGSSPLVSAAFNRQLDVVYMLIEKLNCSPHVKGYNGRTLLHYACQEGHIQIVDKLVTEYKFDPMVKDDNGDTPLHIAAMNGQIETVEHLITLYVVNMDDTNKSIATPLMVAVQHGRTNIVNTLLGHECNLHVKDCNGDTLLHYACRGGHIELTERLVAESLFQSNNDGNTPLHIAAQTDNIKCVQLLLAKNVPLFVRNKRGKTPLDLAKIRNNQAIIEILKNESRSSTVQQTNQELFKLAEKEFAGKKHLSRLFVAGHPGAGKSTLIETIKKEGFFNRFITTTVEPHTAGIVPSTYDSNDYGRIIFHDFAGDSEYYSSHAAIMESIDKSKGINIYLVVCDLSKGSKDAKSKYSFWLSFLHCNIHKQFSNTIILPVGSHADLISKESSEQVLQALNEVSKSFSSTTEVSQVEASIALDCRRKGATEQIKKLVKSASLIVPPVELTLEASMLLGLLRKDFDHVPACKFNLLITHVKETKIPLPSTVQAMYDIVKELHDLGLLMIIERENEEIEKCMVILNISEFTSDMHKELFSISAKQELERCTDHLKLTVGIIPESLLEKLLPEYITKDCLVKLQYCQEIENVTVQENHILCLEHNISKQQQIKSQLFFPALICDSDLKLEDIEGADDDISLGWYAKCADDRFDYFPTRFHHVLTVHLSITFALKQSLPVSHKLFISDGSATDDEGITSNTGRTMLAEVHASNPRCQVWSTGVYWLNNGVEVFVDLPSDADNKELIVVVRSSKQYRTECANTLRRVVQKIIEAKAEFCHSILPTIYLLDPTKLQRVPFTHARDVSLYALSDIEKAQAEGSRKPVTSVDGRHCASSEDLTSLTRWAMTYWSLLFPIDNSNVEYAIEEVVDSWKCFGLNLGLSSDILEAIDMDHPKVADKKSEMIQTWMTGSTMPTWSTIVEAFLSPSIDLPRAAEMTSKKHNVPLQNMILNESNSSCHLDIDFLQSFADIIGPRWQCLVSPLSLTSEDIVSIKRDTRGAEPTRQALVMLQRWAAKDTATYGQLRERLFSPGLYNLSLLPSYI